MQTRARSCTEGRWRLQAACMSQQPWDDSDSQETAAVSSLMPAFHHPDCLFLQECQEMHGEFAGSACGHHGPYTPDVLFWSCILFFTTFILSSTLKTFKTSRYFPTRVGSTLLHFFCVRLLVSQNPFSASMLLVSTLTGAELQRPDAGGRGLLFFLCPTASFTDVWCRLRG